jgi:hypothetical protein
LDKSNKAILTFVRSFGNAFNTPIGMLYSM